MSVIQPRLQYYYAILDENDCCHSVVTSSYYVPLDSYIEISSLNYNYIEKYFNRIDGKWYYEPEFITEFNP